VLHVAVGLRHLLQAVVDAVHGGFRSRPMVSEP
jgi:hypothetical protein